MILVCHYPGRKHTDREAFPQEIGNRPNRLPLSHFPSVVPYLPCIRSITMFGSQIMHLRTELHK